VLKQASKQNSVAMSALCIFYTPQYTQQLNVSMPSSDPVG